MGEVESKVNVAAREPSSAGVKLAVSGKPYPAFGNNVVPGIEDGVSPKDPVL
jgi:hypothetical protein